MEELYEKFLPLIEAEDKEKCVDFALQKLEAGDVDIVSLYTKVLAPALNDMRFSSDEKALVILTEHVRSSIARTIIECCYPYVVRERDKKYGGRRQGKAMVVCPAEEYHEIGARMVSDFFTLLGYDVAFAGANTPKGDVLSAVKYIRPRYVALSVSSFYNLVAVQRTVEEISEVRRKEGLDFEIIVGGNAFRKNPEVCKDIGADHQVQDFEELIKIVGDGRIEMDIRK